MSFTIPQEYAYVLAALASTTFVQAFHMMNTSRLRKIAKIDYPATYASDEQAAKDPNAFKFNCAQRSHANFTENHASALVSIAVAGVYFPTASTALGGLWSVGRVLYGIGYVQKGPRARAFGSVFSSPSLIALQFMAVYSAYQLITA